MSAWTAEFPDMRRLTADEARRQTQGLCTASPSSFVIFGTIDVPYYEPRYVLAVINGDQPLVFVDGPTSPHRYHDHSLCMWYPGDPDNQKWQATDGVEDLLYRIRNHLFREAYHQEHQIWLGPEKPHGKAAA
jgi:hypothetical protein